ncbi:MAG: hypothetical protein LBG58_05060 [Planctomycetaceae bacterium]|nr:hypothetical protein [Planctomycetaceae bacterium]
MNIKRETKGNMEKRTKQILSSNYSVAVGNRPAGGCVGVLADLSVDGWKLKTNSVQHNKKPTGATFRRKVAYLPRLNSYLIITKK